MPTSNARQNIMFQNSFVSYFDPENVDEETPASTQLMQIYEDVHPGDEAAFNIDVPTGSNSPQHLSAQPDPEQCNARGTLWGRQRAYTVCSWATCVLNVVWSSLSLPSYKQHFSCSRLT